jgi:hypothetical protein
MIVKPLASRLPRPVQANDGTIESVIFEQKNSVRVTLSAAFSSAAAPTDACRGRILIEQFLAITANCVAGLTQGKTTL